MNAKDIINAIEQSGISRSVIRVRDAAYSLPKKEWLFEKFAPAFEQLKSNLGASQYIAEVNDCDDFAHLASWYIRHLHRISAGALTGISFGNAVYKTDAGFWHEINIAVVSGGEVVFFEPQTSKQAELSFEEIFLCSSVNI